MSGHAESIEPFLVFDSDSDGDAQLILTDDAMVPRVEIFEEFSDDGWSGNGYDWSVIAKWVWAVKWKRASDDLHADPESGMMFFFGARANIEELGAELARIYSDPDALRAALAQNVPD